jgi:CBS domain-containing protein
LHYEEFNMEVSEAMSRDVRVAHPNQSIAEAARIMAQLDVGFPPVGENDELVGVLTDRDIVIRAVAAEKNHFTAVRDVMSRDIKYCFEDDDVESAARLMSMQRVRRMLVVDRNKRLVGVLALSDVVQSEPETAAGTLRSVSQSGGPHNQRLTADAATM